MKRESVKNKSVSGNIHKKISKTAALSVRARKRADRAAWIDKFMEKATSVHKRNLQKVATKMMKKCDSWKSSLVARSKKYEVDCNVTVDELRELIYKNYGTKCKYCDKILEVNNLVIDHIIPISKGGSSNIENLQIICNTSNSMKGSLEEINFNILLDWLDTVPPELKKDVTVRLARGIR